MENAAPPQAESAPRPDASMTLLTQVMENPLDPGYADLTARRKAQGWRATPLTQALVLLVTFAIGAALAVAVVSLRSPASGRTAARALLIEQIEDRRATQEGLSTQNADLSAQILELTSSQLAFTDPARRAELERLAVVSGVAAVQGPGVVVVLTDSERAQEDPATYGVEMVQARDIQLVVNALWLGGAEAIAVNGMRIGANGGIRGAGQAILVDRVAATPPYEISAIGPREDLTRAVATGSTGAELDLLRVRYGITTTISGAAELRLPGAATTQIRFATADGFLPGQTGPSEEPNEGGFW